MAVHDPAIPVTMIVATVYLVDKAVDHLVSRVKLDVYGYRVHIFRVVTINRYEVRCAGHRAQW
jgi:hypothetical protein